MAKTTRASMARRLKFTPELLAYVRRRFEESDEPLSSMAAELNCCKTTLRDIAEREGWVRYAAPPRDLSPAARLSMRAEKLAGQGGAASFSPPPCGEGLGVGVVVVDAARSPTATPLPDPPPQGGREKEEVSGGEPAVPTPEQVRAAIAALHADISAELADFKVFRDGLKNKPSGLLAREQLSRTFAHLTATLHRLQMMLANANAVAAPHHTNETFYDDMPADLDAFRDALARRIRLFVEQRRAGSGAGEPAADGAAAPPS